MLEKEPSGASPDRTQPPQIVGAAHGGPSPRGQPPVNVILNTSSPLHQYTLQFLIAVIKKPGSPGSSTCSEKAQ